MKLKLILTTATVGVALALPSMASAAPPPPPPPQLDTATATGSSNGVAGSTFSNIQIDAHSGPSGENPGGSASFDATAEFQRPGGILTIPFRVSGPVTCLNVTGNEAVIKINAIVEIFGVESPAVWEINLVDNGGSGSDTFGSPRSGSNDPADCSGGSVLGFPLFVGRAVVFDAKPLPTTKDQCKGDGWKQFGFKNQGQCIAFVNHGS
jgi:hypothetical protein